MVDVRTLGSSCLVWLVLLATSPRPVASQQATIILRHTDTVRITGHILPSGLETEVRPGAPNEFRVPVGQRVCFRVSNANRLDLLRGNREKRVRVRRERREERRLPNPRDRHGPAPADGGTAASSLDRRA